MIHIYEQTRVFTLSVSMDHRLAFVELVEFTFINDILLSEEDHTITPIKRRR